MSALSCKLQLFLDTPVCVCVCVCGVLARAPCIAMHMSLSNRSISGFSRRGCTASTENSDFDELICVT